MCGSALSAVPRDSHGHSSYGSRDSSYHKILVRLGGKITMFFKAKISDTEYRNLEYLHEQVFELTFLRWLQNHCQIYRHPLC